MHTRPHIHARVSKHSQVYVVIYDSSGTTASNVESSAFATAAAPVLSSVTIGSLSSDGGTVSATSDQAGKIYYYILTDAASTPSADTIKGQNTKMTVVTPGDAVTATIASLSTSTQYKIWVVAYDTVGTTASSVKFAAFTTSGGGGGGAPALSSVAVSSITKTGVSLAATSDKNGFIYYSVLAAAVSTPSAAGVKTAGEATKTASTAASAATIAISSLTAGTDYKVHVVAFDAGATVSGAVSTVAFTTLALCNTGQFKDGSSCTACFTDCGVCSSGSTCGTCGNSKFLAVDKTNCAASCAASSYGGGAGVTGRVCNACLVDCVLCSGSTTCVTCGNSKFLASDKTACGASCPAGAFESGGGVTGRTCKACLADCSACSGGTSCDVCGGSKYLALGKQSCVTSCAAGSTSQGTGVTGRTCAAGSSECTDSPTYTDAESYGCADWVGYPCKGKADSAETTKQCPKTCDACPASPPVVSAVSVSILTSTGGTLKATSSQAGKLHYVVMLRAGAAPSAAAIKAGSVSGATKEGKDITVATATEATVTISGLVASTPYTVYVAVEDSTGALLSVVAKFEFATSAKNAPVITKVEMTSLAATDGVLKTTADQSGTLHYVVMLKDGAVPTASEVKSNGVSGAVKEGKGIAVIAATESIITVNELKATTQYTVYVVVESAALSAVSLQSFTTTKMSECADNSAFVDSARSTCVMWRGFDCTGNTAVIKMCPAACNVCEVTITAKVEFKGLVESDLTSTAARSALTDAVAESLGVDKTRVTIESMKEVPVTRRERRQMTTLPTSDRRRVRHDDTQAAYTLSTPSPSSSSPLFPPLRELRRRLLATALEITFAVRTPESTATTTSNKINAGTTATTIASKAASGLKTATGKTLTLTVLVKSQSRAATGTPAVNCEQSRWGKCQGTCGGSSGSKSRTVLVAAQDGLHANGKVRPGTACGLATVSCSVAEQQVCPAPQDCKMTHWGRCEGVRCGGKGTQTRSVAVSPLNGGAACSGLPPHYHRTQNCTTVRCCSQEGVVDKPASFKDRTFGLTCAQWKDNDCFAHTNPLTTYNELSDNCPVACELCVPPQDCVHSAWSAACITDSSMNKAKQCGMSGFKTRTVVRAQAFGGTCAAASTRDLKKECKVSCDCKQTPWTRCDAPCGRVEGTQNRTLLTPATAGGACGPLKRSCISPSLSVSRHCVTADYTRQVLTRLYHAWGGGQWKDSLGKKISWPVTNSSTVSTSDPCTDTWKGVVCNKHDEVTEVRLAEFGLQGRFEDGLGLGVAGRRRRLLAAGDWWAASPRVADAVEGRGTLVEFLTVLDVSKNPSLSGTLPSAIGNFLVASSNSNSSSAAVLGGQLQILSIENLAMSGTIPPQYGNLRNLTHLTIAGNKGLRGILPASFGRLTKLKRLHLGGNSGVTGTLPNEYGSKSMAVLQYLKVSENLKVSGTLPKNYANLSRLEHLFLSKLPKVSGTLPPEYGNFGEKLVGFLHIHNMPLLSGTLPASYGLLAQVKDFYLFSLPRLSGTIPPQLSGLASTDSFQLHTNARLSGTLPPELGKLDRTGAFGVHDNMRLSGTLPKAYKGLSQVRLHRREVEMK